MKTIEIKKEDLVQIINGWIEGGMSTFEEVLESVDTAQDGDVVVDFDVQE